MPMVDPLAPWADGPEDDSPLDRQLSTVFRAVPEPGALPELSRQRVAARLRTRARRGPALMMIRLVALGAVIGVGSAAAAQWAGQHWLRAQQPLVTPRPRAPTSDALVPQPLLPRAPRQTLPGPEPELEAPPPEARPSSAAFPAPAPVQSSELGLEAASLERALTGLRGGGSERAARALPQLERHLQLFPNGALVLEARVARVDALLQLGRRADARRELSTLPIDRIGRKSELLLIRAELRADEDCHAALADFDALLAQPLSGPFAERARFGRGACLLRLGDKAGAERDFQLYLERYPNGRFAAQIRARH
jgi:hypothetical protein